MEIVQSVYAQVSTNFSDPLLNRVGDLPSLFSFILNLILAIGTSLVLIMLPIAATAGERAGKWITYIIISGFGLLFVYAIRTIMLHATAAQINQLGNNVVLP